MLATKLRSFEEAFDLLNARFFENALSKSVITIYPTPGAYGHFTPWKSWEGAGGAGYCEINLGAATVNRPVIESIATLVHEMTHQWCYERGVKDTSRGGTYHNKRFKAEAERRRAPWPRMISWLNRARSMPASASCIGSVEVRGSCRRAASRSHPRASTCARAAA